MNGDGSRLGFEESVGIPSVEPRRMRGSRLSLLDEGFDLLFPFEFLGDRKVLLDDGDEELEENDWGKGGDGQVQHHRAKEEGSERRRRTVRKHEPSTKK